MDLQFNKMTINDFYTISDNLLSDFDDFWNPDTLKQEIESKNWALTPSKYIEFIDHDLDIDYEKEMSRIQTEMQDIMKAEKKSQQMLEDAFRGIGYGID